MMFMCEGTDLWYKNGLRFNCTGCGKCCGGVPGYVWVTEQEMLAIAQYLNITVELLKRLYIRQRDNRYALIERPKYNYDCIFLKDKKCSIYPVRPIQCKTFPWWEYNLKSKDSWQAAAQNCEGINAEAPLVTCLEIVQQLKLRKLEDDHGGQFSGER